MALTATRICIGAYRRNHNSTRECRNIFAFTQEWLDRLATKAELTNAMLVIGYDQQRCVGRSICAGGVVDFHDHWNGGAQILQNPHLKIDKI